MSCGTILVTGCSGRMGFKAVECFMKNYHVVGFDVFFAGDFPGTELVSVDMASDESVDCGLDYVKKKYGNKLVAVIHLASYCNFSGGGWSSYQSITVDGTRRLLDGLRRDFICEQFVFLSTMFVHAPCLPGEKITENWPVEPKWHYPKSKVLVEKLMYELRGEMSIVSMRIAGVYDDRCHSTRLANQIQRIYENQLEGHVFPGDISHGVAFVHMDDVIESFRLAVEKRKELPSELTLLIGEEETLSYDELQRRFSYSIYGKEWNTVSLPKSLAKIGARIGRYLPFRKKSVIQAWRIELADEHYELDVSKARKFLNWIPKRSLKSTYPLWIEELKKEPLAWYHENKLTPSSWVAKQKSR